MWQTIQMDEIGPNKLALLMMQTGNPMVVKKAKELNAHLEALFWFDTHKPIGCFGRFFISCNRRTERVRLLQEACNLAQHNPSKSLNALVKDKKFKPIAYLLNLILDIQNLLNDDLTTVNILDHIKKEINKHSAKLLLPKDESQGAPDPIPEPGF